MTRYYMSTESGEVFGLPEDYADPTGNGVVSVVVIDPEDEGDVAALVSALHWDTDPSDMPATWRAQDALRALTNPQPPKPEEPTGLGAVVEDDEGALWVQVRTDDRRSYRQASGERVGRYRDYADIAVAKVLSEGVPS